MSQRRQENTGGPGGRLWLLKWLVIAGLVALLLVLVLGGEPVARASQDRVGILAAPPR